VSSAELTLADLWNFARWLRVRPPRDASFDNLYAFLLVKRGKLSRPTDHQVQLARDVGVKVDPRLHVAAYVGGLINVATLKSDKAIIDANPALRKDNIILFEGNPSRITRIAAVNHHWMVWLKPLVAGSNGGRKSFRVTCLVDARLATAEELANFER